MGFCSRSFWCQGPIKVITNTMEPTVTTMMASILLLPMTMAGVNDTVDQLRNGFTIVPLSDQGTQEAVIVEHGSPPEWLSGTLARHACGVYGETGRTFINENGERMINACDHVFDCIEMGQGYHFHEGQVTFTSRFYDTDHVALWRAHGENMNYTSVWWGTVYAHQNLTAKEFFRDWTNGLNHTSSVPAVSWWKVGKDVLGMSEWPAGVIVDPHSMEQIKHYEYKEEGNFLGDGFHNQHSAAHEQYDSDGRVWSSAAVHKYDGEIGKNKRVIFTLNPETQKREMVGEWHFSDTNLTLCQEGSPYPDPEARLRQVHTVQMTEHFIVVPETSYMYDPCVRMFYDPAKAGWEQEYNYEPEVDGLVTVMNKTNGTDFHQIRVPPMMITHTLGAYEDPETNELHFDVLHYDNALAYTYYTFIDKVLDGKPHPNNMTKVMRYTLNMGDWTLKDGSPKDLIPDTELNHSFEFSNINPSYLGKKYKFGYFSHNVFKTDGAVVKVNVDTGETIQKKLPNGLFPTEPIFVARPGAVDEDDGVVVMSGIDGGKEKGYVIIYDAKTMDVLFRATATRKTLFGVHSKFFSFTDGCWQPGGDCTPSSDPTSNPTTDPTTMTSDYGSCPEGWMDAGEMGCFYVSTELTVSSWYEANLLCEDLGGYLVEPMSEQIQAFLSTMLVMLPEVAGDLDWWIGLTDTGHEGTWV